MSISRLFPVFSLILIVQGCATSTDQATTPKATIKPVQTAKELGKKRQVEDKNSIDPDVLFMLMTAEIAGQRGQYDVALEGYMEAAKRIHDPRLTERAAMIAMYMKDSNKMNEAVSLWVKQDPENLSARKIAALSALKAQDKKQSVAQLNGLLKRDPQGFEKTLFELAGALQKDVSVPFLYEVMEELAQKQPNQAPIYFIQSLLASDLKNKDLAERKIEQAIRLQPDWDKALLLQAQLAVSAEDYPRAETLLRNDASKYPDNQKFNKMLAQVLIKEAKYEEAGEAYETLIASDPKDYESQFSLGLVHLQQDHDSKAEDIFTQLLEQKEWRNQASFYLGKIEEKRGSTENALNWFDKVADGPFQFEAAVTSISLLAKAKQYDRAEQRLKVLQDAFPKQKPRIVLVRAELYSQQKQYQTAFDYLTAELKNYPDQEELLYSRALMADRMDKLNAMEEDLKKILAKSPDNVEALNALGYSLADKTTRYAEAETYLLHALRLRPDEAVIQDSYGWLKYKMGNNQLALDYLQKAYDKQAEAEIAAHLAEVLWVMGKKDEAKKLFAKAIESAPDDTYLLNFKKKFLLSPTF